MLHSQSLISLTNVFAKSGNHQTTAQCKKINVKLVVEPKSYFLSINQHVKKLTVRLNYSSIHFLLYHTFEVIKVDRLSVATAAYVESGTLCVLHVRIGNKSPPGHFGVLLLKRDTMNFWNDEWGKFLTIILNDWMIRQKIYRYTFFVGAILL